MSWEELFFVLNLWVSRQERRRRVVILLEGAGVLPSPSFLGRMNEASTNSGGNSVFVPWFPTTETFFMGRRDGRRLAKVLYEPSCLGRYPIHCTAIHFLPEVSQWWPPRRAGKGMRYPHPTFAATTEPNPG